MLRLWGALAALALIIGAGLLVQGSASAHERRVVGEYQFVVGFLNEPSLAGQPNGLFLRISLATEATPATEEEEAGGVPVEGAEETLTAEVIVGGGAAKKTLELEPEFGQPGAYAGRFIPTLAGDYSFHIFGDINGDAIDETFSSGPETFDSVEPAADLQFPNPVPDNAELKSQIDALANKSSGGSDDTARTLGIIGIIAGVVGAAVGGYAIAASRRS